MAIVNGVLDYNYGGVFTFHTAVEDDGSFSVWTVNPGSGQLTRLEGKILQDSIEASTLNRNCRYNLTLKKVGTPSGN
jgi:hypothetical protein